MIEPEVRTRILEDLDEFEVTRGIDILMAVENGARNWNLDSPTSDYDVRFIYRYPTDRYLEMNRPKNAVVFKEGDADYQGFDIYKAADLLLKSNCNLIEWLISDIRYRDEPSELIKMFREIARKDFNPLAIAYHYRSMGLGNYKKYIKSDKDVTYKRYVYAFRGIINAMWVKNYGTLPPLDFEETVKTSKFIDHKVRDIILNDIIPAKRRGGKMYQIKRHLRLDIALDTLFDEYTIPKTLRKKIRLPHMFTRRLVNCAQWVEGS